MHQYIAGLLLGSNIVLQPDKVDARMQRVIRRVLLTLNFNVSAEMASVPTVLCGKKGVVQIDSLEPRYRKSRCRWLTTECCSR